MPKVTRSFRLYGFNISKKHFQNIMYYTKHIETLRIFSGKIDLRGVKFLESSNYKLKNLCLDSCGSK